LLGLGLGLMALEPIGGMRRALGVHVARNAMEFATLIYAIGH
jgi:hypothetical protein